MLLFSTPFPESITPPTDTYMWSIYIAFVVIFFMLFVFRDTISQFKERTKAMFRQQLYKYAVGVSIEDDMIVSKQDGAIMSFVKIIDEMFLEPSEAGVDGVYDYLVEDDIGLPQDNINNTEEVPLNKDSDLDNDANTEEVVDSSEGEDEDGSDSDSDSDSE